MKYHFIETKYNKKFKLPNEVIDKLPKTIGLFSTVQFIDSIPDIVKQLKDSGIKVVTRESKNYYYNGKKTDKYQILGCNLEEMDKEVDGFLYIGDGLFHPKNLVINNTKHVHIYDPISHEHSKLTRKDVQKLLNRKKAGMVKFHSSKNIGVIISTKPGQNMFMKKKILEDKYPDKKFFYLVFDAVNYSEIENFPFIECLVNTACPRMGLDDNHLFPKPICNLSDVI